MIKLRDYRRVFDIELTNRCNALCTFCPRDQTPDQGYMDFDTFKQAVARAAELGVCPDINSTGQGEPMLHPQLVEFASYVKSLDLPYSMTTNGSLLTEEKSAALLDIGMDRINFSISDLGEDYHEVYALDFDTTQANILRFLEMNNDRGKPTEVMVNLVEHDLNRDKLTDYRKYWKSVGVDWFLNFKQNNRGGACDNGHYFLAGEKHKEKAQKILQQANISPLCGAPFMFVFVGWNGQYYICCNDYKKTTPLGTVFDHGVKEMDLIKKDRLCGNDVPQACDSCNMDITNQVREVLYEIEEGESSTETLDQLLIELKQKQNEAPDLIHIQ